MSAFDQVLEDFLSGRLDAESATRSFIELSGRNFDAFAQFLGQVPAALYKQYGVQAVLDAADVLAAATRDLAFLEGNFWANVGLVLSTRGHHVEALDPLRRALAVESTSWGSGADRLRIEVELGISLSGVGGYAEASATLDQAQSTATAQGHRGIAALALLHSAATELLAGDAAKAEATFEQAVRFHRELSATDVKAQNVGQIYGFYRTYGEAARDSGNLEIALRALDRGYAHAIGEKDDHLASYFLRELGLLWLMVGETERGGRMIRRAAAIAVTAGAPHDVERWLLDVGEQPRSIGPQDPYTKLASAMAFLNAEPADPRRAQVLASEVLAGEVTRRNKLLRAEARFTLARAFAMAGDAWRGIPLAESALAVFETQQRFNGLSAFALLGNLFFDANRPERAEQVLRRGAERGEALRSSARTGEARQAVSSALSEVYRGLAYVQVTEWRREDGSFQHRRLGDALVTAQRLLGNNFVRWFGLHRLVHDAQSTDLSTAFRDWRTAEVRLEVATEVSSPGIGDLLSTAERARRDFEQNARAMGVAEQPVPIFAANAIAEHLEPGEVLVQLLGCGTGLGMIGLESNGALDIGGQPRPRAELRRAMQAWFRTISVIGSASDPARMESAFEAEITALVRSLDDFIARPLAELVRAARPRKLYVVPHGALWGFPFSMLTRHLPGTSICVLPSPALLTLGRKSGTRELRQRVFLCDPSNTLPFARREASELPGFSELGMHDPSSVFERAAHAGLVHFSGHGVFRRDTPLLSGLAGVREPIEDALLDSQWNGHRVLTTARVYAHASLPKTHLATLSGCSTGVARDSRASDFGSMPSALLLSGVRNVVASLWPIDDRAAYLFMRRFYTAFEGGAIPSVALASARAELEALTRDEAAAELGGATDLPRTALPFASPVHGLAFQHYGFD